MALFHAVAGTYRLSRRERMHQFVMTGLFLPLIASIGWTLALFKWLPDVSIVAGASLPLLFLGAGLGIAWREIVRVTTIDSSALILGRPGQRSAQRISAAALCALQVLRKSEQAWLRVSSGGSNETWAVPNELASRIEAWRA